jgi:hypothetical protein
MSTTTDETVSANVLCIFTMSELSCLLAMDPENMLEICGSTEEEEEEEPGAEPPPPHPVVALSLGSATARMHESTVAMNMISRIFCT